MSCWEQVDILKLNAKHDTHNAPRRRNIDPRLWKVPFTFQYWTNISVTQFQVHKFYYVGMFDRVHANDKQSSKSNQRVLTIFTYLTNVLKELKLEKSKEDSLLTTLKLR